MHMGTGRCGSSARTTLNAVPWWEPSTGGDPSDIDGQASGGRLTEVITHPGGGEDQPTYEFLIAAELPGSVMLRRRLYWGEDDGWLSPERWTGRRIRFRHNTLDLDDLYDVRFDGWADEPKKK